MPGAAPSERHLPRTGTQRPVGRRRRTGERPGPERRSAPAGQRRGQGQGRDQSPAHRVVCQLPTVRLAPSYAARSVAYPSTLTGMHPVRFETLARDGAARAGVATTARGTYTTPCFMPVGTRGAVKYLSAADYETSRRPDRPRQHLPPDAAARRRRRRPVRRARTVRRLERPDADRLRWLPGLLAGAEGRRRRRDVPQHVRRHRPIASRQKARWRPSSCSAPTSRWCSTCARRCRASPT